jgi:predicted transcriptional regulator
VRTLRAGLLRYDPYLIYAVLKIAYESGPVSVRELVEEYRNRTGVRISYYKLRMHVEYAVSKGLLQVSGAKPAYLSVTEKGKLYIARFESLLALLS